MRLTKAISSPPPTAATEAHASHPEDLVAEGFQIGDLADHRATTAIEDTEATNATIGLAIDQATDRATETGIEEAISAY